MCSNGSPAAPDHNEPETDDSRPAHLASEPSQDDSAQEGPIPLQVAPILPTFQHALTAPALPCALPAPSFTQEADSSGAPADATALPSPHEAITSLNLEWIAGAGPLAEVVIASRVRVARNLRGFRFPLAARPAELEAVRNRVNEAARASTFTADFASLNLADLSTIQLHTLVEKHLLSPLLAHMVTGGGGGRSLLLGPYGILSGMVNEEDHLRLQCLLSGLETARGWRLLSQFDDALESTLDFAFSSHLGYMTACPSNVGTGLRASVMLHLPAIALAHAIEAVKAQIVSQVGLAVRGLYGEGTAVHGNLLQISNQISLGPREEDIEARVRAVAERVVEQEMGARARLRRDFSVQLGDKLWRALGILRHARVIAAAEALELLSMVRLGIELEILPPISRKRLNALLVAIRPATLQVLMGQVSNPLQADILRAQRIRAELGEEA